MEKSNDFKIFLKSKLSLRVELPFLANLECYGPAA